MTALPEGTRRAAPMRIAYLLSQYPVPTQTFAQSDIAALRELGHTVAVFTMKPRRGQSPDPQVQRPSLAGALRWPGALLRCRASFPFLLAVILRHIVTSPKTALTALACLPRAAEIADTIARENYAVAHLVWARHAGLVLTMLARRKAAALRSVFVGAYDLVADDFIVALAMDAGEIVVTHAEANRDYLRRIVPADKPTAIIRRGIPLLPHAPGLARVAVVASEAIGYLATTDKPPAATGKGVGAGGQVGVSERRRVTLGAVPDFGYQGPGVRVDGVVEGSPAVAAGLAKGDVIVGLGGKPVADLNEFTAILRGYAPGDRITVRIRRGDAELEREATLAAR